MKKVLIFSGTTEGRKLAMALSRGKNRGSGLRGDRVW